MLASSFPQELQTRLCEIITKNEQILFELDHHVTKKSDQVCVWTYISETTDCSDSSPSRGPGAARLQYNVLTQQAPSPNKNLNDHDINKYI